MNIVDANLIALRTMEICNYVPIVSTAMNLVHLFVKCVIMPLHAQNPTQNRYYNHLNNKSFSECIVLLIPVIGNIYVWNKHQTPVNNPLVGNISWSTENPPNPLPGKWAEMKAAHSFRVSYAEKYVHIPIGDTYYTYGGKIVMGYQGSYNPPRAFGC